MKRKDDPEIFCFNCKKKFVREYFGKRLQDLNTFKRRKFCSRICYHEFNLQREQTRQWIGRKIQKYKKEQCEKCSSQHELQVHHIDRDWKNNLSENLITFCASCHAKEHHKAGDFSHIYELANETKRKKHSKS